MAEGSDVTYRLPTKEEWLRVAKAGATTRFWWGDEPDSEAAVSSGANFKGRRAIRQPAIGGQKIASTSCARLGFGGSSFGGFQASPWGLWHTFGNVGEWAVDAGGDGHWIMGGDFRTERDKANFRPEDLEIPFKKDAPVRSRQEPVRGYPPGGRYFARARQSLDRSRSLQVQGGRQVEHLFANVQAAYDPG